VKSRRIRPSLNTRIGSPERIALANSPFADAEPEPFPVRESVVLQPAGGPRVAVLGLVKPGAFVRIWRTSRVEAAIAAATFAVTLLTAPRMYWGILVGVLLTLSHFLYERLHPRIIEVGLHADGRLRDRHLWHLPPLAPHTYALRMDADLDFGSASALENAITSFLAAQPDTRHVMLFAQPINRIDTTGVEVFGRLRSTVLSQGRTLYVVGLKLPVETTLRQAGELPAHPALRCFATEAEALADVTNTA
jgi:SulP family sulfate permease